MTGSAQREPGTSRRYPGVRSFEDDEVHRQLFRGRDRESYDFLQLVLAERLGVLFARSGVGKSSIINAGLMQPLRESGRFPMVVRVTGTEDDPLGSFYKGVKAACDQGIERQEIDAYEPEEGAWNRSSLWHFFKTFYIWRGAKLLQPVVIIDQFEELFTLVSEGPRARFINELADLVRGRRPRRDSREEDSGSDLSDRAPDVKVVLSIREDFIADMEELAERIPTILKSRFRLNPLSAEQAKLAITEPASLDSPDLATPPFTWSDEGPDDALQCTLDFLCKRKTSTGETEVGDEVEPFQLQLVCQHVENLVQEKGLKTVSAEALGGEDALEAVLNHFYKESIDSLCDTFPDRHTRRRLENLCENGLITAKGRRLLREESTIGEDDDVSPDILAEMVELRLIRKEPRVGDNYYELTHDTLIAPILASREAREGRKKRRVIAGIAGGALAAVAVLWFGVISGAQRREAELRSALYLARTQLVSSSASIRGIDASGELKLGVRHFDTLEVADTLASGLTLEAWDVEVDGRLRVSLSSTDFDSYLVVVTPDGKIWTDDDSGANRDAELTVESGPGRFPLRIVAMGFSGQVLGEYSVTISEERSNALTLDDLLSPAVMDAIPKPETLPVGTRTPGSLSPTNVFRGLPLRAWTLPLEGSDSIAVELSSDDFETALFVWTPSGDVLYSDDQSSTNSRVVFAGAPDEEARVVVASLDGQTGNFTIGVDTLEAASLAVGDTTALTRADLFSPGVIDAIPVSGIVSVGSPVTGNLSATEQFRRLSVGAWDLRLDGSFSVTIDLTSDYFDTVLYVRTPSGGVLYSDDFGGSTDSRLELAGESGVARVVAAGFYGDATGEYRIAVSPGETTSEVPSIIVADPVSLTREDLRTSGVIDSIPTAGTLSAGTLVPGNLSATDDFRGLHLRAWDLALEESDSITVELSSDDFDTVLFVRTPSGEVLYSDDFGGSTSSRLLLTGESGVARVVAAGFYGDATGAYTITPVEGVTTLARNDLSTSGVIDAIPEPGTLRVGTVTGNLSTNEFRGLPLRAWDVPLDGSDSIIVEVSSDDFDTVLYALMPSGEVEYSDDFDGTDSRLVLTGGSGVARVVVAAYSRDATGEYTITVSR